ncbi:MAG TPA: CPBP family intramembrane glutamic endopeptidase, partial [Bryobacterales bacterium]|nr:CPBP family intramembrane glutamic endopeptidase [Bryobacterales bacterium]
HLIRACGPWISIVSTSALFGWMHSANPAFSRISMLNTALFGAVFGYAYWQTLDLWLPLGMHFAWNFSLATIGANVSGLKIKLMGISVASAGSPLWSGGDYGPEGSLLTTLVLAAIGVLLWKAPLGRQRQGILSGRI